MKNLDVKTLTAKLGPYLQKLHRYKVIIFVLGIVTIYSFLVFRINTLNSREPSESDVSAELQITGQPKIDPSVIQKIQQLQDNSADVKALFNQARDNPFQE